MNKSISADYPFESNYISIKGSKIHYVDVGEGDPILFLHGNPTSSYLWRNIIPYLSGQGRCIAPDLIGMGKSDKLDINYGFKDTYAYLVDFIEKLDLKQLTLVVHDWGSGLGFHYAHQHEDNIKGIAFMESVYKLLDTQKVPKKVITGIKMMRNPFMNWLMPGVANLFIRKMLPNATMRELTSEEKAFYAIPYPTIKSRKPLRVWPTEIAIDGKPEHTFNIINAYHSWLKATTIPKLCIYGDPGMLIHISEIPWIEENLPNIHTVNVGEALHFIQEDRPHEIGEAISNWYGTLV